ncbi:MAG TPA: RNA polymerase sigma factor [Thermoanaerobaculia bacterium]|nr:RNA polymerase sigma factor [Thermoanaerobaculia bacterium]
MNTKSRESGGDEAAPRAVQAPPDESLVAAAIEGDQLAFDDLVSRHRQAAVRVAEGIVGPILAEGVVQDALLMAHRALASLKDQSRFSRWLLAITRWRALRTGRQESRPASGRVTLDKPALETLSGLVSDPRQTAAGDELLIAALENLPPEYGEVIRYHFLHGMPHRKIAEFLDIPVSTVKWRCFRAKEILRCSLSSEPTCDSVCREGCSKFPSSPLFQIAATN